MTEQEKINENLQRQIDAQTARIDNVLTKVDMVIGELHEQREDMRRIQEQHNADMKEMREDIKGALKHIQGLTIASMVGIAAIAIATWVFVLTDARNDYPPPPPAQVVQPAPQSYTPR